MTQEPKIGEEKRKKKYWILYNNMRSKSEKWKVKPLELKRESGWGQNLSTKGNPLCIFGSAAISDFPYLSPS